MNDFGVVVVGTALGTVIGVAFTAAIGATLSWFKWPFHRLKHTYQRYQSERERRALEAEMQELSISR